MSEEERKAYLQEKARKEAEARAAAEAKARAEETKAETVRVRLWRSTETVVSASFALLLPSFSASKRVVIEMVAC